MSATSQIASPETAGPLTPTADLRRELAGASVLMTDENYKHSLGIMRQLGRLGVQVSVVASSRNSLVCSSRYCHEIILSKAATIPSYIEAALEAVRKKKYDLLMPVSFPMTLAVARNREKFIPHVNLQVAGATEIGFAANKTEIARLAQRVGVPTPKTFVLTDMKELESVSDRMKFPVVVKPQMESRKGVVAYAHDFAELRTICSERLAGMKSGIWETQILQEFIPGYGCGFFATYQKGECKRVFMHRRVREYPPNGGASTCAESFHDARLQEYGKRMLDALDWHGVAMVEFRRDSRDGDYKLIEVNPKFWGSLDLSLAAGADFPADLCRMALGETLQFTEGYKRNLRFQWIFSGHGDLFHLWTRPKSFVSVLSDILNPNVKTNVWPSDLSPTVRELRDFVGSALRRRRS